MNFKSFSKIAYHVSRKAGAKVCHLYESSITPNFHVAEILYKGKNLFLISSIHNDWAISSFFNKTLCKLDFFDCQEISDILEKDYEIKLRSKEELNSHFIPAPYISQSDVTYWKPKTMGEALFNWWD